MKYIIQKCFFYLFSAFISSSNYIQGLRHIIKQDLLKHKRNRMRSWEHFLSCHTTDDDLDIYNLCNDRYLYLSKNHNIKIK